MKSLDLPWINNILSSLSFSNLPHGIIISGPDGIGKKILANAISSRLLINKTTNIENSDLVNSNSHPDFFYLNNEKVLLHNITFRKNKWDDEKGQRNVNDFLSKTPSISINKVAVIVNAQTMNDESQNALLKSLEEPSPNSYIIMITNRPKCLLNTIYSRCQVINIPSLQIDDLNEWLINNGVSDVNALDFPSFTSPLKILEELENNQHLNFKQFIKIITEFIFNNSDTNSTIKNIISLDIDLIMKINYLIEFLKIILKSRLLSEDLSGVFKDFNSSNFNNLKISNLMNELNALRYDYFKVPQINETHVLNYYLSELKNSIKI
ncbi:MAG: DNA polymerase III subunit delta' [SAR86 cluster bacterium]|uniref:DNA-directed DNA polymerase n=1 Tax=SAR86 cluster bacterium TaxID=2030880 RepID=A0A520N5M9_9GAMM|nr:MAG: DNA polymerase III subunit delta' [SAR86 cluster bacterium]|tara:strand:+ start:286 stop:1254 length:969 start_codon:yes stop_codon:yes gene_type:complete